MIEELKKELEKTFNRKIQNRGDCEGLVQNIYERIGIQLSYNTIRRMFGLAEYRKPRLGTLNYLANYCGFKSFNDFCHRYTEIDSWPTWEKLYTTLSTNDFDELIQMLLYRKIRQEQFTISFVIVVREFLYRKDIEGLKRLFREPEFQFSALPYDEVAQIGVLVGMHFRNFSEIELEHQLLLEPNFRDIVFKIYIDYGRLDGKYGNWISFLLIQKKLDSETKVLLSCLEIWRSLLLRKPVSETLFENIPELSFDQHPILYGRIFGIKYLTSALQKNKSKLMEQMRKRLSIQPNLATELLYEPAFQSLVFRDNDLISFISQYQQSVVQVSFWYHFPQISIHRILQASILLEEKKYSKALGYLENLPFDHIRHGYREFIELFVSFFRLKIAHELPNQVCDNYIKEFNKCRSQISYTLFSEDYFNNYFLEQHKHKK